jgi:hypothetical protein
LPFLEGDLRESTGFVESVLPRIEPVIYLVLRHPHQARATVVFLVVFIPRERV